jgi:hypothetical protein
MLSAGQKILNSIRARSLQHRLYKHLLDEIDAHYYGDLILNAEVNWASKGKVSFWFQEFPPEIVDFPQD